MRQCVCGKAAYIRASAGPTSKRKAWMVLVDRCLCGRMYAVKDIPADQQKWVDRWNARIKVDEVSVLADINFFRIPPTARYVTVVAFEEEQPEWSLVVEPLAARGQTVSARIRFLAPGAPHTRLAQGTRFRLLEGSQVVGEGRILDMSTLR